MFFVNTSRGSVSTSDSATKLFPMLVPPPTWTSCEEAGSRIARQGARKSKAVRIRVMTCANWVDNGEVEPGATRKA
jgi:hypothetical protein